jgi:hypothetical protein
MKLFCFALLILIISCKPASKGQSVASDAFQKIVAKELSDKSIVTKNNTNSFALAYQEEDGFIRYIIVRLTDNNVVRKEKIRGSVSWVNDMQIKESIIPGIVKKDAKPDDNTRIIDLNQFIVQAK